MKQRNVPAPKPAPIQQFIEQLREREAASVVIEVSTPPLDLSKIPSDWKAGIRSPEAAELPVEGSKAASAGTQANEIQPDQIIAIADPERELFLYVEVPAHWSKGALLNVRNCGDHYCVTLYPEEFDPRHPERAMTFPNTWECQDFVSKWYARETADPRAR